MKTRATLLIILLSVTLTAWGNAPRQEGLVAFTISGSVQLDEGQPVSDVVLELSFIRPRSLEDGTEDTVTEQISVTTQRDGSYQLNLNLLPEWEEFTLKITTISVDTFQYDLPNDRVLTDALRNAIGNGVFELTVNWTINTRPQWQEENAEIERYGADSEKGRLIRVRGLPDKITTFRRVDGTRGEIWFFYSHGIAVRFLNDIRDKDFYFRPR